MEWLAERLKLKPWALSKVLSGAQAAPEGFWERAAFYLNTEEAEIRPVVAEPESKAA